MTYHASHVYTDPGQIALWPFNPEPHLAVNPYAAGPPRVGLGCGGGCGCGGCAALGQTAEEEYAQTSYGMLALVGAGAFLGGLLIGWAAKSAQSSKGRKRGLTPNARWSRRYKNRLPDSAFLYVDKAHVQYRDAEGRSHPLSTRKLPVRNIAGNVDVPHAKNAIARAPRVKGISAGKKRELQQKARRVYYGATGRVVELPTRRRVRRAAA